MLAGRPLFPTRADSRYFVWTESARRLRESLLLGRNTLVIGRRGSGKTSMLHMVEQSLREQETRPVAFVSLAGIVDAGPAVLALHRVVVEADLITPADDAALATLEDDGDPFGPTALLRRLRFAPRGTVLLVDDVDPVAGAILFGRLRDELWQLPLTWAVAAGADDAGPLVSPPADAFFERRIEIPELAPQERYELLRLRTKSGPERMPAEVVRSLADLGSGNPRQLIALARDTHDSGVPAEDVLAARERRWRTAQSLGGPGAAKVVAEMEGLGPVTASDPRLLDRLGWDRPRLARVLANLERKDVLRSYLEPREGRIGRPRKLYQLKDLRDFAA